MRKSIMWTRIPNLPEILFFGFLNNIFPNNILLSCPTQCTNLKLYNPFYSILDILSAESAKLTFDIWKNPTTTPSEILVTAARRREKERNYLK
jgi:hypothetical protein